MIVIRFDTPDTPTQDVIALLDSFYGTGAYSYWYQDIRWIVTLANGTAKENLLPSAKFSSILVFDLVD